MKHQDIFSVEFTSVVPRQFTENGITKTYFRNNFVVDGKTHSVASPQDLSGLTGEVMFVEKGQPGPDGSTLIVNNGFAMVGVTTIAALQAKVQRHSLALQAKKLEAEAKGL